MIQAVVADTGVQPSFARMVVRPIIQHLCSEYGGNEIYIPALPREYPVEDIRGDFARSRDVDAVCKKYTISRRTLYRLLGSDG